MDQYQYPIYPTDTATWSSQFLWRPFPQEEVQTAAQMLPHSYIPTNTGDLSYPTPQQDPWLCSPEEKTHHPTDECDPSHLNSWWNPFPIQSKEQLQAVEEILSQSTDNYWRLVSFLRMHDKMDRLALIKLFIHSGAMSHITWSGVGHSTALMTYKLFQAFAESWTWPCEGNDTFQQTMILFIRRCKARNYYGRRRTRDLIISLLMQNPGLQPSLATLNVPLTQ